jgi:hypothetical protein
MIIRFEAAATVTGGGPMADTAVESATGRRAAANTSL